MSYTAGIPNANDLISQSQAQIQTNFTKIDSSTTGFAVDHVTLTDNTDGGKHKKVTFNNVAADPTLSSPQTQLYTKASSNATVNNRFNDLYYYEKNVAGTSNVLQLTGGGIAAAAWVVADSSNNIQGSYNVSSVNWVGGSYTVNFTRPFATANSYAVIVTLDIDGESATANATGIIVTSRSVSQCTFTGRNQLGGVPHFPFSAVFFGVLA